MERYSPDFIRFLVETEKRTSAEICVELQEILISRGQNINGVSKRSLGRFMQKYGIGQHWIDPNELDALVSEAIQVVGDEVGGKLMTGHLRSEYNLSAARSRVQQSLRRVNPEASALMRLRIGRLVRPGVYHGRFFGYNLHMDQNEKLNMYGATFVIAVDGHSSCVVGAATMVRKNNIVIYDKVFKSVCQLYGLWNRVIVDHGREFF